jgi:UDP-glucose 4-epimerase
MKCIVTGGAGFIGSHVVQALKAANHDVLAVDKQGNDICSADICDTQQLIKAFKEFDAQMVFHLAAVADARHALANPVNAVNVNIGGTASVFEAARQAKVKRVILASTCWVCGAMRQGLIDETEPFSASGAGHVYTTSKIAAELLAHDFKRLYGLPFTILRYGIPYGPGMWPGLVLRAFLDRAFAGQPLTIFGDGSVSRRFVFVKDLAQAHVLALQEVAENQTYNLEGMRAITIKELAELVAKLISGVKIEYKEEPTRVGEFKQLRQLISNAKAYVELGWEPKTDLEEGVRQTVEWYKANMAKKT